MNLEHAKLFKDIAQSRSVSRAAALNSVSQSAASQHLQDIERTMEVTLLDRSTRPLRLTPAGRLYYEFCRDILRRKEDLDIALEGLKGRVEGTVRVASIYSIGLSEMTSLEEEFGRRFPDADLQVDYLRPEKVYEAVLEDRADLGLVSYPEATKEIMAVAWRHEKMVLATAPGHSLARKPMVEVGDLQGEDFVGFDEDLPISREVNRFLREHGVEVNLTMHFDNIQMMKEAVALGSGISILPERILLADVRQGRLATIPIDAPELFRPVGIIHRRRKKFNRATQLFLNLLQEQPAPERVYAEST